MNRIPDRAPISKIRNFRGCYMRDELRSLKSDNIECGVLNLNSSTEQGSHWTCWFKTNNDKYYFNSFGLPPPNELIHYLGSPILYSTFQLQAMTDQNCGKWCVVILKYLNEGRDYVDLILSLLK